MESEVGQLTDLNDHFIYTQNNSPPYSFWTLDPNQIISTNVVDGLVFNIQNIEEGSFLSSGWLPGSYSLSEPIININSRVEKIKPWNCQIHFTDSISYISPEILIVTSPNFNNYTLRDEEDQDIGSSSIILGEPSTGNVFSKQIEFDFYVYDKSNNKVLDLIVIDVNDSGEYEKLEDKILVGNSFFYENILLWSDTRFSIQFFEDTNPGDIYGINYNSPFVHSDTLFIHTNAPDFVDNSLHDEEMNNIKVVPNPYVASNLMEEAFSNPSQSQERKIMFTHLPSRCIIKIFTVSGVLVDQIEVNNGYENGIAYWDLLSNEGLQVAAGMYIYHVQSQITDKFKIGKFAIIK